MHSHSLHLSFSLGKEQTFLWMVLFFSVPFFFHPNCKNTTVIKHTACISVPWILLNLSSTFIDDVEIWLE